MKQLSLRLVDFNGNITFASGNSLTVNLQSGNGHAASSASSARLLTFFSPGKPRAFEEDHQ
jgi:hypothetical protein